MQQRLSVGRARPGPRPLLGVEGPSQVQLGPWRRGHNLPGKLNRAAAEKAAAEKAAEEKVYK